MVVRQKYLMPFEEQDSEDDWIRGIIYEYHTYALHESIVYKVAKIYEDEWREERGVYIPDTNFPKIVYLDKSPRANFDRISDELRNAHPPSDLPVKYQ